MQDEHECYHENYTKTCLEQKWTGHSTCLVLALRNCTDCGHSQEDWEFGDHESIGGPRMFPDDINFFTGKELPKD